ncbi:ArsR/SmtB family transcription factor [Subtercola sp. YIM 133946]|uniref:ArsR/SmtB family transcription factor n=1 Tax=Subtercola sp. YIM 133946 TaxID=3118909 RepID=UPI003FCDE601
MDGLTLRAITAFGASPTRVEIVRFATGHVEFSIHDICVETGLSRPSVRMHLGALEALGLVTSRRDVQPRGAGAIRYWSVRPSEIADVLDDLCLYVSSSRG